MQITGVIAEYNPFHNGHVYHLACARRHGASHIVCVLGGHFTQRGGLSCLTKWARAEMALRGGADLVIELPLAWSLAPAQRFAKGGVALLQALGCVDVLSFGAECSNLNLLEKARDAVSSPTLSPLLQQYLSEGMTFAAARQRAVETLYGTQSADLLKGPNNILAISYLSALQELESPILAQPISRRATAHDGIPSGHFSSAGYIRKMLSQEMDVSVYLPASSMTVLDRERAAGRAPITVSHLEQALLARLRALRPEDFAFIPDLSEGLENRLKTAVRESCSYEQLLANIKVKRYPLARIRRHVLSAAVGLRQADCLDLPPYIRVLGFNQRGREILKKAKTTASLPILLRCGGMHRHADRISATFTLENQASDLYALAFRPVGVCGMEYTSGVVTL